MPRASPFDMSSLPASDPSVELLHDDVRALVTRHWVRRAKSEQRIGTAFESLHPRLSAVGAHPAVLDLCLQAAAQEARHAEVCAALAAWYAGVPKVAFEVEPMSLPTFGCREELEVPLLMIGTCCINETLATAWLRGAERASTAPMARAANRGHLREEIDHARMGWAHLASDAVPKRLKSELQDWLVPLLHANVPRWEEADPFVPEEGVPGHGLLSLTDVRGLIRQAVRDVLLPGFAHVGFDIREAEVWLG